jgi:putative transposase
MADSFFSTLEAELLSRRRFGSQAKAKAKMACFRYIESRYDPMHLYFTLGYQSPMAYQASWQLAEAGA